MIEGEEDEMIKRLLDDFIWLKERERERDCWDLAFFNICMIDARISRVFVVKKNTYLCRSLDFHQVFPSVIRKCL